MKTQIAVIAVKNIQKNQKRKKIQAKKRNSQRNEPLRDVSRQKNTPEVRRTIRGMKIK